jgi:hypothetical protein
MQRPKDREIRVKNDAARGRQNRATIDFQTLKKKKVNFLYFRPSKASRDIPALYVGPQFRSVRTKNATARWLQSFSLNRKWSENWTTEMSKKNWKPAEKWPRRACKISAKSYSRKILKVARSFSATSRPCRNARKEGRRLLSICWFN